MIRDPRSAGSHYDVDVRELSTISDFEPKLDDPDTIYVVPIGDGMHLPFYVGMGEAGGNARRTLRVGLHGAKTSIGPESYFFAPVGMSKDAGNPFLLFDDPTLYLDDGFKLTWYLGTTSVNPIDAMTEVVKVLARRTGAVRQFCMGSSGGGFAAVQLALRLEQSVALAVAPQTDVFRYHQSVHLGRLLEKAWGGVTQSEINERFCERFRLADAIDMRCTPGRQVIRYVQNEGDQEHLENHLAPMLYELGYNPKTNVAQSHALYVTRLYLAEGHVNLPAPYWNAELMSGARILGTKEHSVEANGADAFRVEEWRREENLRRQHVY